MMEKYLKVGNMPDDRNKYSSKYPFNIKVICGECGNVFRRRTWNSISTSKKIVWKCKTYIQKGKDVCTAKSADEKVLENLRQYKSKIGTGNLSIEQYKERIDEIIKVIKEQEGLFVELDDKIFNALIDRIEVLESTHFVFVLRNGMRVEENIYGK